MLYNIRLIMRNPKIDRLSNSSLAREATFNKPLLRILHKIIE